MKAKKGTSVDARARKELPAVLGISERTVRALRYSRAQGTIDRKGTRARLA